MNDLLNNLCFHNLYLLVVSCRFAKGGDHNTPVQCSTSITEAVYGRGRTGRCFNFHSGRAEGGTLPPGPPPSLPWTPSPPPPSALIHLRIRVLGMFFRLGQFFPPAPIAGFFGHSTVSFLPSIADTMSQRPISAFFSTPVQPCPRAKRNNVVNLLYFRFQDRWTGKKRHRKHVPHFF